MYRFLATAVVLGTLAVPSAASPARTVIRHPGMERSLGLADAAHQLPQQPGQAKGKARREPHPYLRAARRKLEGAKQDLQKGATDFGGHRVAAIKSIDEALEHIRQAENYDKQ